MKKVLTGWLGGHYDDLSLHEKKVDCERGMKGYTTLDEDLKDFKERKVRITIELIDDDDDTL